MDKADMKYIKMTETPIPRLVITLGIPTTISMLITNIYNMADSYFVSQISESAGGATSVVFGIMTILQAFGFMFGHGAGSQISRFLGKQDSQNASKYASTSFFYSLLCGILILAGGLIFLEPLMMLLGSTDTILPYAKDYGMWILIAAPAMCASCVLNNILRYEGMATLAMIGLTTGGILNMILDPVFIFELNMGIGGAGFATAISQYISFGILLYMFLAKRTQSKLSLKFIDKKLGTIGSIIKEGLPSFARQGLNSVSTVVLNTQAKAFGDIAIAAMGYVSKTAGLIFSVGLGIGQGFQPVVGFNYGAKKYERVRKSAIFTFLFSMVFLGVISVACYIFANDIIYLFGENDEVTKIGGVALKMFCISMLFFPVSVVATMLFQSIGKSVSALILSCLQNGLLLIPMYYILPIYMNITGIQVARPLAYILSAFASAPMLIVFLHKLKKQQT
ncbi:MAG: MATE family efflux transporter [Clostridia bacterium]|nr:MATE family efflux transporter [Clostridia bacterium]